MLWLIASEDCNKEGQLPDWRRLSFRLRIREEELIGYLQILKEWLIFDDTKMISSRYHLGIPETETETEGDEVKRDSTPLSPTISQTNLDKEASKIAEHMAEEILLRDPGYRFLSPRMRTKTLSTWAADISKINRIDQRDWQQIWEVVCWCMADDFWCRNIFSGKKLRQQFDKLVLQQSVTKGAVVETAGYGGTGQVLL